MAPAPSPASSVGARGLIAALGVVQILAWGSSYYLLAVLAAPIAADTGWPLQWVVGSLSLGLLVAGLASPRVGALIGARGGRPVLMAGCGLLALGLVLLASAQSLPVFALGWCVMGAGMAASLYDAAFAALGRLHGAGARRPITLLTLWGGFASTVCWPLSAFLVAHLGWRGACLTYALVQAGVCVPLIAAMMPRAGLVPAAASAGGAARAAVLRPGEGPAFRLVAAIVTLAGTIAAIISVELLALLQAQGLGLAAAVAAGTVIGPSQVFARVIEQVSGGRHHPLWTMTWAVSLMAGGLALLAAGFPLMAATLAAYGAGNGLFSIAKGAVPLALFGAERYPALMGRLARPALIAQAAAPLAAAFVLAGAGAPAVLASLAALGVANVGLVAVLWRRQRRMA
ncbi:MFS transporter [Xanthobacter autotrophicus DSM 431]|uniref:MFS transporter n=1 Tax=Xanthobacter nonsaccharivorans TaxID=3119912 RepID=UPI003728CDEA